MSLAHLNQVMDNLLIFKVGMVKLVGHPIKNDLLTVYYADTLDRDGFRL